MLSRSGLAAGLAALLVAVAASGAFPLPPLPGMFPASAGGGAVDDASSSSTAAASVAAKPPAQMTGEEYIAAANAPRGAKTAAGVVGDAGTGFQWEDVLKAGREGRLDPNTNGDEVGSPAAAPGAAEEGAAAAAPAAAAPAAAAPQAARRTPPSQLPVASPAADAAAKSAAAWADVMAAGRAGTLDPDTTGAKAPPAVKKQRQEARAGAAAAAPAAAP